MSRSIQLFFIGCISLCFSCKKAAEKNPPTVNLGPDKTEVDGVVITLNAGNAGAAFLWSTGAMSQTISADTAGTYWVRVTADGLTASDTIKITRGYELVKIETSMGNMLMWLYNRTPNHKQNFLTRVKQDLFNDSSFNRVVDEFVIQGGCPDEADGYGDPQNLLNAEFNTALTHVYGAVGAGRYDDATNPTKQSNMCQFYIVEKASGTHFLNNNYTIFGIVMSGLPVVSSIAAVPKDANDKPLTNIPIQAKVVVYSQAQLLSDFGFTMPD